MLTKTQEILMLKIDGFWTVNFDSNRGSIGSGVAVIDKGRIFGGDSIFMYTGNVKIENSVIHADIYVSRHNNLPIPSIFGQMPNFQLKVSGSTDSENLVLTGHMVENPDLSITLVGTYRADLALLT
jgi:T3SS negative regulator,GrlR